MDGTTRIRPFGSVLFAQPAFYRPVPPPARADRGAEALIARAVDTFERSVPAPRADGVLPPSIAQSPTGAPHGIRQSLVQRVRAEIAAGTYVTKDRLDAAIDSLLSDLCEAVSGDE